MDDIANKDPKELNNKKKNNSIATDATVAHLRSITPARNIRSPSTCPSKATTDVVTVTNQLITRSMCGWAA